MLSGFVPFDPDSPVTDDLWAELGRGRNGEDAQARRFKGVVASGHGAALALRVRLDAPAMAIRLKAQTYYLRYERVAPTSSSNFLLRHSGSMHIHAAVDADRLTGHEVAVIGGEKNHRADKVLRILVALEATPFAAIGELFRGHNPFLVRTRDR